MRNLTSAIFCGLFTVSGNLWAQELTEWEKLIPNEVENANRSVEALTKLVKTDYLDKDPKQRAFRDAHPRGIGCVKAKFTVNSDLGKNFQTALFQPGKSYESLIRYSSAGGAGVKPDTDGDARGFAIKLLGVPGKKILANEADAKTHDFILINFPTFPTRDAAEFQALVEIRLNPALALAFPFKNPILRARELKRTLEFTVQNRNNGSSLAVQEFFSQVPYLFEGNGIRTPVKYMLKPCGSVSASNLDGSDNELRNDLQNRLKSGELCWEFGAQAYRDGQSVEDGMEEWKFNENSFIKLAKISIPAQKFVTDEKLAYCDKLSMNPWHALPAHRPIGNINRTRKIVYEKLSEFRHRANSETRSEPTSLGDWDAMVSTEYGLWAKPTLPAMK